MSDHDRSFEADEARYAAAHQSNGSGPSRKRTRVDDEGEGSRAGPRRSHGGSSSRDRTPATGHDIARQRARPVPLSMFGLDARNDLTREIGSWIINTCQGLSDIEVSQAGFCGSMQD